MTFHDTCVSEHNCANRRNRLKAILHCRRKYAFVCVARLHLIVSHGAMAIDFGHMNNVGCKMTGSAVCHEALYTARSSYISVCPDTSLIRTIGTRVCNVRMEELCSLSRTQQFHIEALMNPTAHRRWTLHSGTKSETRLSLRKTETDLSEGCQLTNDSSLPCLPSHQTTVPLSPYPPIPRRGQIG